MDGALDDFLLVVGRDKDGDFGLVGGDLGGRAQDMGTEPIVDGKEADGDKAASHQNVAKEKDDGDGREGGAEKCEADPIQTGGP